MNISVIGPTYPYKGGISHFTTLLVQHLRKKNNVDFISWKRQYPSFLYPVALKDTQSKQPIKTEATFLLDFFNPISWIQAVIHIRNQKADLLILTWASPIQSPIYFFICSLTKILTKTKILYICHNVLPHETAIYDKPLLQLAFKYADIFIVHSSDDKDILEKMIKNKNIIIGFHPIYDIFNKGQKIDIQKIKNQLQLKSKVLLFFGYIRPYKGLKYLIQAMPDIIKSFSDISLLVVGEFWLKDKKNYFELINNLNIDKNIKLINKYIPNEEVSKYFLVADVVVLPYTSATQSGITQIAEAFRKPVISTTVGGLNDVIEKSKNYYTIRPHDPKDIANKVKQFYLEKDSSKNIQRTIKNHTWIEYVELISKLT